MTKQLVLVLLLAAGCHGAVSPSAPAPEPVTRTFSGQLHWDVFVRQWHMDNGEVLAQVTLSGVSLSGELRLPGLGYLRLPVFACDSSGACVPVSGADSNLCGHLVGTGATVMVSGRHMQVTVESDSDLCGHWHLAGELGEGP